jgi:hypothetical protein
VTREREPSEPPDLFWWDQVHTSLLLDATKRLTSDVCLERISSGTDVDLTLHPETTNIKLVARWKRLF